MKRSIPTLMAGFAICISTTSGAAAQELQKLKLGFGTKIVSPMIANILIPEYLGYYRREGLTLEFFPLGPNTVVMEQIASKRIDFATGVPTVQLPVVARGETLPTVNFYEFTYPFKYGLATNPDSRIGAFADLKGKTVGVSSLGLTDYPIFKLILKRNGIDPDKDVNIIAVGEGVVGGQALKRGAVEALFSYDTQFGSIEAVGIPLRYIALPKNVPHIGGFYLTTRRETLKDHRNWAVGVGRAVAKAQVFIRANPDAAAYAYLQMFPEFRTEGLLARPANCRDQNPDREAAGVLQLLRSRDQEMGRDERRRVQGRGRLHGIEREDQGRERPVYQRVD